MRRLLFREGTFCKLCNLRIQLAAKREAPRLPRSYPALFFLVLTFSSLSLNHVVSRQLSDSALWHHRLLSSQAPSGQHHLYGVIITEAITRPLDLLSPPAILLMGLPGSQGGGGRGVCSPHLTGRHFSSPVQPLNPAHYVNEKQICDASNKSANKRIPTVINL